MARTLTSAFGAVVLLISLLCLLVVRFHCNFA